MAEPRPEISGDRIKVQYILGNFFLGSKIKDLLNDVGSDFRRELGDKYLSCDILEIEKTGLIVDFRRLHGEHYGTGKLQTYLIIVYTR